VLSEEYEYDRSHRCRLRRALVKWRGQPYEEATWEIVGHTFPHPDHPADQGALNRYRALGARFGGSKRATAAEAREACRALKDYQVPGEPEDGAAPRGEADVGVPGDTSALPTFESGRKLRGYQVEGLKWMVSNFMKTRSCILGDEMGLGKTAQSISVLQFLRQKLGTEGPFLVVAPLSTLGHWQREIETWTDMHCVPYYGSRTDREIMEATELLTTAHGVPRFSVLLTSPELLGRTTALIRRFTYSAIIVDEAHRLKSRASQFYSAFSDVARLGPLGHGVQRKRPWRLLLTGTPIQNNVNELYSILSVLDPDGFPPSDDGEAAFLEEYGGGEPTPEQIARLQQDVLRPVLLRRMKEDVENLPEKEEVIVWTELTTEQRRVYKATFEKRIGDLLRGAGAKTLPSLNNVSMLLREVCNHPFLVRGLEDELRDRMEIPKNATLNLTSQQDVERELGFVVKSSGKMVLLQKLLAKLKAEGRKVLIFSQFKIMLDILEWFLQLSRYGFERIDGNIKGLDRQEAIDRFMEPGGNSFVFLLSTRAGGQGITLTAADTVIIYDSDWNPQNDLQAMARCHRIGQESDVTVYRLICRDTYEEAIFQTASRKYGLDEAILGTMNSDKGANGSFSAKELSNLIKYGAHMFHDEDGARKKGEEFENQDIDAILSGRTEKRTVGSRKGNLFSEAKFSLAGAGGEEGKPVSDDAFWRSLLPDAAEAHEQAAKAALHLPKAKRRAAQVKTYNEVEMARALRNNSPSDDEEYSPPARAASDEEYDAPRPALGDSGPGSGGEKKKDGRQGRPPVHRAALLEYRRKQFENHGWVIEDLGEALAEVDFGEKGEPLWERDEVLALARAVGLCVRAGSGACLAEFCGQDGTSAGLRVAKRDAGELAAMARQISKMWQVAGTKKEAEKGDAKDAVKAEVAAAIADLRQARSETEKGFAADIQRLYERKAELVSSMEHLDDVEARILMLGADDDSLDGEDDAAELAATRREKERVRGEIGDVTARLEALEGERTAFGATCAAEEHQVEKDVRARAKAELKRAPRGHLTLDAAFVAATPVHGRAALFHVQTFKALAGSSEKGLASAREAKAAWHAVKKMGESGEPEYRRSLPFNLGRRPQVGNSDWWEPHRTAFDMALLRAVFKRGVPAQLPAGVTSAGHRHEALNALLTEEPACAGVLEAILRHEGAPPGPLSDRLRDELDTWKRRKAAGLLVPGEDIEEIPGPEGSIEVPKVYLTIEGDAGPKRVRVARPLEEHEWKPLREQIGRRIDRLLSRAVAWRTESLSRDPPPSPPEPRAEEAGTAVGACRRPGLGKPPRGAQRSPEPRPPPRAGGDGAGQGQRDLRSFFADDAKAPSPAKGSAMQAVMGGDAGAGPLRTPATVGQTPVTASGPQPGTAARGDAPPGSPARALAPAPGPGSGASPSTGKRRREVPDSGSDSSVEVVVMSPAVKRERRLSGAFEDLMAGPDRK